MPSQILQRGYRAYHLRKCLCLLLVLALLVLAAGAACCLGVADLTPTRLLATYLPFSRPLLSAQPLSPLEQNVLLMLRMPRIAMAIAAGAGLGVSGAVMQAITGNSMASPFTTGLSNAAALGAAIAILFGGFPVYLQKTATVLAAFLMTLLCAALVYGLSSAKGLGAEVLVLTGIALNYLFSAINSSMQFIANEQQLPAIVHWTFGSLTGATWGDILVVGLFLLLIYPVFQTKAWSLNLMSANGDESAAALGVNVRRTRLTLGVGVAFLTAAVVSFTGIIGFVGLVAPHMARILMGGDHRQLLPFSALAGSLLVLVGDTVGRVAFSPTTIPVGIVVSYVGVPLFLYLILRERSCGL